MDSALQRDSGVELFVVFLAGLVIVFTSLAIYFTLAMRPVMLAALIVFLPVAHAVSVWTPMRRVQVRAWSLAFAVLLSDAAILTMFAVTNTVMGQPEGVDRLIFGTFGLLLAALAPAALARIVGAPELQTAVQSMSRGSRVVAVGAGALAVKGALMAAPRTSRPKSGSGGAQLGGIDGGGSGGPGGGPGAGRGPGRNGPGGGAPASGTRGQPNGPGGQPPAAGGGPSAAGTSQQAGAGSAQGGSARPGGDANAMVGAATTTTTPVATTTSTTADHSARADTSDRGWQAALNGPAIGGQA